MHAQMMNQPLIVSSVLEHAARFHGTTEIVSRTVEGGIHRYTYADAHKRAKQGANALQRLGVNIGSRVGTLAWNNFRHFELYYAISGIGAVTHTLNPKLFPDQVSWIVNDAQDEIVFFDTSFSQLIESIAPQCPSVRHWVAMTDPANMPDLDIAGLLCYEDLIARESKELIWPRLNEETASSLCYTSGTTGNPKGVLYSHRSTLLHAFASALPDGLNLAGQDVVLPVVPMFHVNAWGLPYSAPLVGAKLVLPCDAMDGANLHGLFENEGVTFSAGVPTVWLGILNYLRDSGSRLTSVKRMIVGGAACPPALMQSFKKEYGVRIQHAWGMTEMSPLGTVCTPKAKHLAWDEESRFALEVKQGRPPFGVDLKIVDDSGHELPWDGATSGNLFVRGHWVVDHYFNKEDSPLVDGWFPTGDVANLDPDGYLQITDRSKDVIKSGGEWISSIELENIAMSHPAVAEAATLGLAHDKWDERPLLVAVRKDGQDVSREELLAHFEGKVARFCIPDDVVFVEALPHAATGKISKVDLRKELSDYRWPAPASAQAN